MLRNCIRWAVVWMVGLAGTAALAQTPVGTTFTYQGSLKESGSPAGGSFLMEFRLFDSLSGGAQVGTTVGPIPVVVADGLFTQALDFGAVPYSTGEARWLQITVDGTILTPRQPLTPTPFSLATRGIKVGADGRLAVGNAAPTSAQLTVERNNHDAVRIERAGVAPWSMGLTAGGLAFTNESVGLQRLLIAENGNIGVGTNSPSSPVSIRRDNDGRHLRFERTGLDSWWVGPGSSGGAVGLAFVSVSQAGEEALRLMLAQNGNVGIGANGSAKLTVAGLIHSTTGGIRFPDGTTQLTAQLVGPAPAHEWSGSQLRFQNPNGSWGAFVDLRGPQGPPGTSGVFASCTNAAVLICGTSSGGYNGPTLPPQASVDAHCAAICASGYASAESGSNSCTISIAPNVGCSANTVTGQFEECGPPGCGASPLCNYGRRFPVCCACIF